MHRLLRAFPEAGKRGDDSPGEPPPHCQFCGLEDLGFKSGAALDLHYWKHCPLLIQCEYCEQVVELMAMTFRCVELQVNRPRMGPSKFASKTPAPSKTLHRR